MIDGQHKRNITFMNSLLTPTSPLAYSEHINTTRHDSTPQHEQYCSMNDVACSLAFHARFGPGKNRP